MSLIVSKRRWLCLSVIFALALLAMPGTGFAQDEQAGDQVAATPDDPSGETTESEPDGPASEGAAPETEEETAAVGLDEKVDKAFAPIATWWENTVLYTIPGTPAPRVLCLLVIGAAYFTL